MTESKNNIFAEFKVSGLEHISINSDNCGIPLPGKCRPMQSIQFLITANQPSHIYGVKVVYQEGTQLNNDILNQTTKFIERAVLVSMIQLNETISKLHVWCDKCYDSQNGIAISKDYLQLREKVEFFVSYGLESFESMIQDEIACNDPDGLVSEDFELLKAISNISDTASRYLLGYQMLMNLVRELDGSKNVTQKQVTNFILNCYNPAQTQDMFKIGTQPTRRQGQSYDEDTLTWYRNVLGHPPITEAEQAVLKGINIEKTFQGLLKGENHVLLFAIREKFNRKRCPPTLEV